MFEKFRQGHKKNKLISTYPARFRVDLRPALAFGGDAGLDVVGDVAPLALFLVTLLVPPSSSEPLSGAEEAVPRVDLRPFVIEGPQNQNIMQSMEIKHLNGLLINMC